MEDLIYRLWCWYRILQYGSGYCGDDPVLVHGLHIRSDFESKSQGTLIRSDHPNPKAVWTSPSVDPTTNHSFYSI